MRCSPACFSGRQPAAHSLRATHVAQKFCHSARRRRCTQLERTLLSGPYTDRRNTMQSVCRAERGSTASETSELPQSQPVVVERNARSQVKETANVAMVAGVAIALSAMLAVPGPADAAEAVSLDFLTKFLASVYATIPTYFAVIYVCTLVCPTAKLTLLQVNAGPGTTTGPLGASIFHYCRRMCRDDTFIPNAAPGSVQWTAVWNDRGDHGQAATLAHNIATHEDR